MHPSLPAALLMLLLAGGWLLGRRRARPYLRSTNTAAVAELNRSQIDRLKVRQASSDPPSAPAPEGISAVTSPSIASIEAAAAGSPPAGGLEAPPAAFPLVADGRPRRLIQLQAWMRGSREQRLQALDIARQCDRREALPLLRLGLRDPDPAVMAAAAAAMVRFRGRSVADGLQQRPARPVDASRLLQVEAAAASRPRSVLRTR
jgi:hypothetical protein